MRKTARTTILVLVLCISMVLALTACGGGTKMEGKYVISAMKIGDMDYLALLKEMSGSDVNLEDIMSFEFSGDNKVKGLSDGDEATGTYKLDGKKLTITIDGEDMVGTVDGKSFTVEMEEDGEKMSMTFTKK